LLSSKHPPTDDDGQISRGDRKHDINKQAQRTKPNRDNDDHDASNEQVEIKAECVWHALAFIATLF